MTELEIYRSFVVFLYLCCIWQMAWFIYRYVKVVVPLKDKIASGELLAPPKWVTLEYHLCVGYVLIILTGGVIFNLTHARPLNPFSLALTPAFVWLFFILRRFRKTYEERLRAWVN